MVICHGVNSHGGQYLRAGEGSSLPQASRSPRSTCAAAAVPEGERFHAHHVDEYVSDLSLAVDFAKRQDPAAQCFLLGHSAGGVTSVSYALDYQDRLDGLICESFAFRVFAPDIALALLGRASHVLPDLPALKLKMEDFSRDPAWVEQLLADPYTKDEAQPVETVAALVRAGDRMEKEFGTITLPVLILHGTADKATRPDGSQEFYDHAGSADKQLILYQGYYHDLLNDLGRERVMADILGWIEARLKPAAQVEMPMPAAGWGEARLSCRPGMG